MKCNKCGSYIDEGLSFCPYCGNPLSENASSNNSVFTNNNQGTFSNNSSNTLAIRILVIIGSIMCVVGVFLPFVKASAFGFVMEKSFNEMAPDDHIIFLAVAGIGLLGSIFEKYILPTLTGALYGVMLYIDTHDYFQRLNESGSYSAVASKGFGYYCMLAGLVIMVVFGIVGFSMKIKEKRQK